MREPLVGFFRRRTLWILLYSGLVAYGIHALIRIPVEVLPAFDFPQINAIAQWPGAGAKELEISVTRPLEAELLALPDVKTVRSAMGGGIVTLSVRFRNGTHPSQDLQTVYSAIDRAKSRLPPGVNPYAQVMGNAVNEVADYAISLEHHTSRLKTRIDVENQVLPALRGLPGVQHVYLIGGGTPAYWIQPRPSALIQAGLTLPTLADSLKKDLVLAPAGHLNWGHQQVFATVRREPASPAALSHWLVTTTAGHKIPLQEVARVVKAPQPVLHDVLLDGRPSLYLVVMKQQGASTAAVDGAVSHELQRLRTALPHGAAFVPIYRQAHVLRLMGSDLGRNLLIGGAFAILVLMFFLGTGRGVLILALTIPLSLLSAISVLYALGQTLNLLTLGALTVAVGLLADDGIIVLESILSEWEQGRGGIKGIRRGLKRIALADVTGTLTTTVVFIPLMLAGGLAGLFTTPFSLAMISALGASLLISLSFVPLLMAAMKRYGNQPVLSYGRSTITWLLRKNLQLSRWIIRKPRRSLSITLAVTGASFAALVLIPFNFLPLPNEGVLLDSFTLPPGTSLQQVEKTVAAISRTMDRDPAVAHVLARIGSPAASAYSEHSNEGEIQIVLKHGIHASRLDGLAKRLIRESSKPGVEQSVDTPTIERVGESLSGLPQPFEVRIEGEDTKTLEHLTHEAANRLRKSSIFQSVFANDAYPVNQLVITPRDSELAAYGVTPRALSRSLQLGIAGKVIGRIPRGNSYFNLYMRFTRPQDDSPGKLADLPIPRPGQSPVPLDALASLRLQSVPNVIRHIDGARMLQITGAPQGAGLAIGKAVRDVLDGMHWPHGYHYSFGGLYKQFEHTAFVLLGLAIAAMILMAGILLLHFDGWLKPALIMLEVPLALGGGAAALAITRIGLNLLGLVGFITLIGVSLNHAIVLMDRIQRNEHDGLRGRAAAEDAVRARFRPILLTTLAAVLGALPTAIGWGIGAAPEQGLAVVIVGGMIWTSLLSANLIPSLYARLASTNRERGPLQHVRE